ncbi:trimethylamine methyltransferase family protein [Halarsenatibacter silvermanii]|uniref:Methyltransferase n=1 Tax=Halarsenatibacter silvermanii TaxID=321763 RepID=A0A1G9GVX8_9FIRM|nr:trimethylamine methyltransferase family protein [Halarsenatibacter silvermanii]SDL04831.1 trimethylamine---corrinoid protein Co-methyltransferase [Halarsenatibacter silvermanii]
MEINELRGKDYKPLGEKDLDQIVDAVYRLLTEIGMEINSKKARQIFADSGAEVDDETKRVRLPAGMIDEALESTPSNVTLWGREERHHLQVGENRVYFGTGGTVLNVLDLESGEKRKINIDDVANISLLVDYLDNIDFLVIPVYPDECEDKNVDINRFYHSLKNTKKHIMGGIYSTEGIDEVIELASEMAGGRDKLQKKPFISFITCVMSPLVMDETYTDFLIKIAGEGLPLAIPAEPLSGATGPMTIAGNIALMAAESLAGVVLAQQINPGTPVLFASTASALDMKQALYITGEIEMGLMHAGLAQLAQRLKLPLYSTAGMSDAKVPDIQAGYESAMTNLITGMAGANFIHDAAGLLEMCQTVSYEKYVVDNEIIGMAKRAIRGIEVNEDTLAFDTIERIGPGGEFLTDEHTYRYMKTEFFQPEVSDRSPREKWEEAGSKKTCERANEMARDVLSSHKPAMSDKEMKELAALNDKIIRQ